MAYAPDGTLYALHQGIGRSVDNVTLERLDYVTTDGLQNAALAIAADGRLALGTMTTTGGRVDIGQPGAFTTETLPFSPRSLLWLPDGRLLAHARNTSPGSDYLNVRFAVRGAAGGWTESTIGDLTDLGAILFDPRPGHHNEIYSGGLRTRDGGASWQKTPTGVVAGGTTTNGGADFVLLTTYADPSMGSSVTKRSLDGGDTATTLATLWAASPSIR